MEGSAAAVVCTLSVRANRSLFVLQKGEGGEGGNYFIHTPVCSEQSDGTSHLFPEFVYFK